MTAITTRKRKTEIDLEKQILIHSILSTEFLKEVNLALKPNHFQIPFAKIVYKWVSEYFNKYGEAPQKYIEDIYRLERDALQEAESNLVEGLLEEISGKYENDGRKLDTGYYKDKTKEYIKSRNLLELSEQIKSNVEIGRVDEAENLAIKYNSIAEVTTNWSNPNDPKFVKSVFEGDEEDVLITMPGAFGEMLGPLRRSWFCSSVGEAKVGKSFFLHEIRQVALWERLNVVEINLEMSNKQLAKRYYQRISAMDDEGGNYKYSIFDCLKNQTGQCNKQERVNKKTITDEYGMKLDYDDPRTKGYKPCTKCRGKRFGDFELTTWFEESHSEKMTYENISGIVRAQRRGFGDNYRIICYPKFSATIKDIENSLDLLEATEGFRADCIILDYADAMKKPPGFEGVDEIWRELARIGSERRALLVTTSHVNERRTEGRRSFGSSDVSGNTSKSRHVDLMFGHFQTPEEKKLGLIRCSVLEHRHKYFNELDEVYVARDLTRSQAILDSEYVPQKTDFGD